MVDMHLARQPTTMDSLPPDFPDRQERTEPAEPWQELVSQIGCEVAAPLSAAAERVHQLTVTGRIDRDSLRSLHAEIERARRVGILSQQIARLAAGLDQLTTERLDLVRTLHLVLAHRTNDLSPHGVRVTQHARAVLVFVDPPLLSTLLNATLDWADALTRSDIDFHVALSSWPPTARLTCSFVYEPDAGHVLGELGGSSLDSLNWQLVCAASRSLGIDAVRNTEDTRVTLALDFPRTTTSADAEPRGDVETAGDAAAPWLETTDRAMVMALVGDPRLQAQLDTATADFEIDLDFVDSIAQARRACRQSLPHVIIFDDAWRGAVASDLLPEFAGQSIVPALIDITAEGAAPDSPQHVLPLGEHLAHRVAAATLLQTLPQALATALRPGQR